MSNSQTTYLTVEKLRKRFWELVPACGGKYRLAARLSEYDAFYATADGIYAVANAKTGRAGEMAMARIVSAMEKMVQSKVVH